MNTTISRNAAITCRLRIPVSLEQRRSAGSKACGQPEVPVRVRVRVLALDRHRELEAVGRESEVEIGRWKAGPLPTARPAVAIAVTEGLQQPLEVGVLAADDRFPEGRAGMVLGVVGRRDERHG